ncbi:hypothetical protein V7S43_007110 [Phytophthora oleae]|uniref:Transmembrane protein n=1 Tax=Phytophthora oleae TaxID=2107226 RepID=A0ABD3FPB9_9STRA
MISPSLEQARRQSGFVPVQKDFRDHVRAGFSRLVRLWTSLQVSYHGGKYSIERVLALDKYTRTTSLFRVTLVCTATPLPMVILVALQELLPLQEPETGWGHNYGFWFRVFMLAAAVSHTYLIQGKYMINDFAHSNGQLAVFVLGISVIYVAVGMLVGANLVFPIPFFYITMTPAFSVPLFTLLYYLLGSSEKLTKYVAFIAAQKMMGMIYPVYQLLFRTVSSTHFVLPVILLLPVLKLLVKNVVLRLIAQLEDLTPETVIFTVDFYNALYPATCMESASTLNTMLIFIVTDFAQTITVLVEMHRRTATILSRLRQATNTPKSKNVLSALPSLFHNSSMVEAQFRGGVQVRSCLQHELDREDRQLLRLLERLPLKASPSPPQLYCWSSIKKPRFETRTLPKLRLSSFFSFRVGSLTAVQPFSSPLIISKRRLGRVAGGPNGIPTDLIEHSNIPRETLEVLYTTECLVLTTYLESFIPLIYCTYMIFMVHLPNAKYHTELKSVTRQNVKYTARVVFLFGLLQLVSFVLLILLVRHNCGMRILYNLAFVLDTQMWLVQGKLIIWMLVTLACRVVHFGQIATEWENGLYVESIP